MGEFLLNASVFGECICIDLLTTIQNFVENTHNFTVLASLRFYFGDALSSGYLYLQQKFHLTQDIHNHKEVAVETRMRVRCLTGGEKS